MEDIKNVVGEVVKERGFTAVLAGVAIGFIAKKFVNDTAVSLGAGLLAYAAAKRI